MKSFLRPFLFLCAIFFLLNCSSSNKNSNHELSSEQLLTADRILSNLKKSQMSLDVRDFDLALAYVDSAESFIPDLAFTHFMRGLIYDELNRLEDAQASYDKVLSIDPNFKDAWYRLGNNALAREQYSKAVEYFQKERSLYPRSEVLIKLGIAYANVYKPDSSQVVLLEAIRMDSLASEAYMLFGKLLKDNGEIEKAERYMSLAIELDPSNLDYQLTLGALLFNRGQIEQAISYLESAIKVNKWDYSAHYNLGRALIRLGQQSEGEKYLATADTLQMVSARIGFLKTNLRSKPDNLSDWIKLGYTLQSVENLEEAYQVFKIVQFLNPEDLAVRENIAYLSLARRDTVGAIREYQKILKQDSTRANTWFNVGVVYGSLGKLEAAKNAWQKTLEYNPNDTTAAKLIERLSKIDLLSIFEPLQ